MNISSSPVPGPTRVPENPKQSLKNTERKRGSGGIFLRGLTWWIRYRRRGRQIRETSGSSDPAVAQKKLDKRTKEIWAERQGLQAFVPKAEKVYVDELLDELEKDYKLNGGRSLPQFRSHVKPIREVFGDMRAVDVTAKVIDNYIDDRLAGDKKARIHPRSAGTINR